MADTKQIKEVKFMYNGIKIDGTLKKGFFHREKEGSLRNGNLMPEQITFYMERYSDHLPKELFKVLNETDSQRDYFDTDKVRFTLDDKYYSEAFKAWKQAEEKNLKRMITIKEKALPAVPEYKKDEFLKELKNTKERLQELVSEEMPRREKNMDFNKVGNLTEKEQEQILKSVLDETAVVQNGNQGSSMKQAEALINEVEKNKTIFSIEERNLIMNYAFHTNNMEKVESLTMRIANEQYGIKHSGINPDIMKQVEIEIGDISEQPSADQELSNYVSNHPAAIKERPTVVINAYGGAGAGKTTACLGITEELKKAGYVAEYVQEYAKELVWEENWDKLDGTAAHQFEILKEQVSRMDRLYGKVDFIVTDAPVLLNKVYNNELTENYERSLVNLHNQYNNFNFVVERDAKKFEQQGRMQNLQESIEKDKQIEDMLKKHDLYFGKYNHRTTEKVVENAIKTLEKTTEKAKKQAKEAEPKEKESFQGYAYEKGNDKATVLSGKSEEEILKRLNVWNNGRVENNKFVTCNIASLNTESGKYEGFQKFEVASGKNITPTNLELPILGREEFKKLTEELKSNGAKFNANEKKWYITEAQDTDKFKNYLPAKELPKEEKLEWSNISVLDTKMQYVFDVEYAKQGYRDTIVLETNRPFAGQELMDAFENALKLRNPERFTEEQINVLNRAKEAGVSQEAHKLLFNPEFSHQQMHELSAAFQLGFSVEEVQLFAHPEVEAWQMNFYQYGLEHGGSFQELEKIVAPPLKNEDEWSQRKNQIDSLVNEKRSSIAKDLEKNGFQVKTTTIKKIERLNFLTKKSNSIHDIANKFKAPDNKEQGSEVKSLIKDIGNELKNQQLLNNQVPSMET